MTSLNILAGYAVACTLVFLGPQWWRQCTTTSAATPPASVYLPTTRHQLDCTIIIITMPASVKIVEEARVALPATVKLPPEPLVLSALDVEWIALPLIQRLLIFVDEDTPGCIPPFASVVTALRASLAETAARFPVLAGRIVHVPDSGDAAIDCAADGGGIRFLVAEMGDDVDAARLAGDEAHDDAAFRLLVPALDAGQLPAEAMAAQVTRLRGGVALGVAMHHAAVDGRSVWRFIQAWAAACRGEGEADLAAAPPPTFDRAAIKLPGGEELARSVLRKYTPNLPMAAAMDGLLVQHDLSRRTFTLSAKQINVLKQRIADRSPTATPPSSFVAVVALAWISFVRAKHPDVIAPDDEVTLYFFADCRARLDPPPGDGYFGTCISGCLARATARDLLTANNDDDNNGLAHAAALAAAEVRRAAEEPLALWDWMSLVGQVDMDRIVNVSGSTRFPAYQAADFGWGQPGRMELVTMNHDGQVVLVGGKGGAGRVQASVSLNPAHMDAFKSCFFSYFA